MNHLQTPEITCIRGICLAVFMSFFLSGCASPVNSVKDADRTAREIIATVQQERLGKAEAISIETPSETFRRLLFELQDLPAGSPASIHSSLLEKPEAWPLDEQEEQAVPEEKPPWEGDADIKLSLIQALQVGARNNRQYQALKEDIFRSALALDLRRQEFRHSLSGLWETLISTDLASDPTLSALDNTGSITWTKRLKTGMELTTLLGIDLIKLLTLDKASSFGIFADATISIPLLRGAGRQVVTEPMTQAEREVLYAMYRFERFKKTYGVEVTRQYLSVLGQQDEIKNALENYRNLMESAGRVRRLADAGRLPEVQVDQALQDSLRAKNRYLSARQAYNRALDSFKIELGLPPDAGIRLERGELEKLAAFYDEEFLKSPGPSAAIPLPEQAEEEDSREKLDVAALSLAEDQALDLALNNRLDLRISQGKVYDKQRSVIVAADGLLPEASLTGTANIGERRGIATAGESSGRLRPEKGYYAALLTLDFPFDKTAERNLLRNSLIDLEQAVRSMQELEDLVKLEVRNHLRSLLVLKEQILIQQQSVEVAQRRVDSTNLFLQAGRVQVRDLLEAQEALVQAKNNLTAAIVNYRISELELQQDLGVLRVDNNGLYQEFQFDEYDNGQN